MSNKASLIISIVALLIALVVAMPQPAEGRARLGVTNFDSIHLSDTGGTATPILMADQRGTGNVIELRDAATPVFTVNDGGATVLSAGLSGITDLTTSGIVNLADTDSAITGAQTITPTYSYLQVSPTALLTLTLSTGGATDGDLLIIHNLVTTNTNIVDTGATAGGGAIDLGQDDLAGFIFGDGVWVELLSPDNS